MLTRRFRTLKKMETFAQSLATARSRRNVKLFNALMSREARSGKLDRVEAAFDALRALRPPLAPNEFTYGILLNAYTRSGALDRCDGVLASMRRDGVPVTTVAATTVIKGHVHALDMASAWAHFDEAEPNIRTVNTMLRGCLYVCDLPGTERLVALAARHGLAPDQATRDLAVRAAAQAFSSKVLQRALDAHAPEAGAAALSPAAQVDAAAALALSGKFNRAAKVLRLVEEAAAAPAAADGPSKAAQGELSMLRASVAGIRAFLERPDRDDACREFSAAAVRRYPPVVAAGGAAPAERVSWNDGAAPLFAAVRPVKLEVGAGTGDWVVKQAEAERNAANWVAVELRCDRSLMIHAKGAMRRLHNLAVLAGDAHGILRDALPSRGVAEVHVNFPQPPQWEGSEAHLVNLEFLREAHRCLVPGGAFLLTTDNERLCAAVAKRLTEDEWLRARWEPALVMSAPYYRAHEKGVKGHASAFDDLWAARGFAGRYQCRFTTRRRVRERRRRWRRWRRRRRARRATAAPSGGARRRRGSGRSGGHGSGRRRRSEY